MSFNIEWRDCGMKKGFLSCCSSTLNDHSTFYVARTKKNLTPLTDFWWKEAENLKTFSGVSYAKKKPLENPQERWKVLQFSVEQKKIISKANKSSFERKFFENISSFHRSPFKLFIIIKFSCNFNKFLPIQHDCWKRKILLNFLLQTKAEFNSGVKHQLHGFLEIAKRNIW